MSVRPRLDFSLKASDFFIAIVGLENNVSVGQAFCDEIFRQPVEKTLLRRVGLANNFRNDVEVLNVNTELIPATSPLGVLKYSTARIALLDRPSRESTNADIDELGLFQKHGVDNRSEFRNMGNICCAERSKFNSRVE